MKMLKAELDLGSLARQCQTLDLYISTCHKKLTDAPRGSDLRRSYHMEEKSRR